MALTAPLMPLVNLHSNWQRKATKRQARLLPSTVANSVYPDAFRSIVWSARRSRSAESKNQSMNSSCRSSSATSASSK